MSTPIATEFGNENGDAYAEVIEKWAAKLKGVEEITDEMRKEWAADLQKALGGRVIKTLLKEVAPGWKQVGALPPEETVNRFAQMSVKRSFFTDTEDLLQRLRVRAQKSDDGDGVTAAIFPVKFLLMRAAPTVAQVFDMVKDRFGRIMNRHYEGQDVLTGRRRWRTASVDSRHKDLNLVIKEKDESFNFKGQDISGPRPPGGSPENWSNCSCFLQAERTNGDWVTL